MVFFIAPSRHRRDSTLTVTSLRSWKVFAWLIYLFDLANCIIFKKFAWAVPISASIVQIRTFRHVLTNFKEFDIDWYILRFHSCAGFCPLIVVPCFKKRFIFQYFESFCCFSYKNIYWLSRSVQYTPQGCVGRLDLLKLISIARCVSYKLVMQWFWEVWCGNISRVTLFLGIHTRFS